MSWKYSHITCSDEAWFLYECSHDSVMMLMSWNLFRKRNTCVVSLRYDISYDEIKDIYKQNKSLINIYNLNSRFLTFPIPISKEGGNKWLFKEEGREVNSKFSVVGTTIQFKEQGNCTQVLKFFDPSSLWVSGPGLVPYLKEGTKRYWKEYRQE